jgi:hypothetical protein
MGTDNTPRKPDQLPPTPTQPKDSSNRARVAELNKSGTEVARAKTDGPTTPPNPEAHSLIGGLRDSAVPRIDQAKPAVKQVAGKDGHGVGQAGKKAEKLANAAVAVIAAWSSIGNVVKNADNALADRPSPNAHVAPRTTVGQHTVAEARPTPPQEARPAGQPVHKGIDSQGPVDLGATIAKVRTGRLKADHERDVGNHQASLMRAETEQRGEQT